MSSLVLEENVIQLWRADLDQPPSKVRDLHEILMVDEKIRADRFRNQKDRALFIVGRGLLRVILASYLHENPSRLRFCHGPYGKPALDIRSNGNAINFNLAHSDGRAIYAVTRGRELGVDLERIRPDRADENVAEQFFSPIELATLRALPEVTRPEGFFACWTRKEAFIKAIGGGLTIPLKQFSVSMSEEESTVLLDGDGDHLGRSRWSVRGLPMDTGWAAALAVEGEGWRIKVVDGLATW